MAKLLWVLLLAFCLVTVNAKKKTAAKQVKVLQGDPEEDGERKLNPDNSKADEPTQPEEDEAKANQEIPSDDDEQSETEEAKANEKAKPEEKEEDAAEIKDTGAETEEKTDDVTADGNGEDEDTKEFACNLKFKRVGCYSEKTKKEKAALKSFIMSDVDMGTTSKKGKLPKGDTFNAELPKFACKCANEAINGGNAIFALQNIAECWTGPDDSKYDKYGASDDCVTFDYAACEDNAELCAGKKHANFVYYVDSPEHTKTNDEIAKELAAKKKEDKKKKLAAKKKASKLLKKKPKKAKKE